MQQRQHRDVEVLMLYPLDLVATDERFGSWMTQYGYANYVPQTQLLERGQVVAGAIEMAGRRFTTLVALFEPFPKARLLEMMRQLTDSGGRVIWSGPPPVLTWEGTDARTPWQDIFGVDTTPQPNEGIRAPGKRVCFEGPLAPIEPQPILTDFLVDRIYPVTVRTGTVPVARVLEQTVGTHRIGDQGGNATFLGYRPRDDQSRSLGYETRNWLEVLHALGAYPASGHFAGVNDNPQVVSRTTEFLACSCPNGAVAIARHFRLLQENWPGGAIFQLQVHGTCIVRIPRGNLPQHLEMVAEGSTPGSRGPVVPAHWEGNMLVIHITGQQSGRQPWGSPCLNRKYALAGSHWEAIGQKKRPVMVLPTPPLREGQGERCMSPKSPLNLPKSRRTSRLRRFCRCSPQPICDWLKTLFRATATFHRSRSLVPQ